MGPSEELKFIAKRALSPWLSQKKTPITLLVNYRKGPEALPVLHTHSGPWLCPSCVSAWVFIPVNASSTSWMRIMKWYHPQLLTPAQPVERASDRLGSNRGSAICDLGSVGTQKPATRRLVQATQVLPAQRPQSNVAPWACDQVLGHWSFFWEVISRFFLSQEKNWSIQVWTVAVFY